MCNTVKILVRIHGIIVIVELNGFGKQNSKFVPWLKNSVFPTIYPGVGRRRRNGFLLLSPLQILVQSGMQTASSRVCTWLVESISENKNKCSREVPMVQWLKCLTVAWEQVSSISIHAIKFTFGLIPLRKVLNPFIQ